MCGKSGSGKQMCITCDDEGQCCAIVICQRQCGCLPCKLCAKDGDGHNLAIVLGCCQWNVLFPCEALCFACKCLFCGKDKDEVASKGSGAPSVAVTDEGVSTLEISRE